VDYNDHRIPDPFTDDAMLLLDGHPQAVLSLAFSPDSTLLASGAKDGGLRLWGVSGELLKEVTGSTKHERKALAWHPAGTAFAVTHSLEFAVVSADGEQVEPHALSPTRVTAVAYLSPELLVVGTSQALHLWDAAKKKPRPQKWLEREGIRAVAVHPPTKLVAWLSAGKLSLWDVTKAKPKAVPLSGTAGALAVSPDGKLAAAATGWNVRVFETTRDAEREPLRGHKGQVTGVAFTPDGRTLLTGGWDETLRLWDVATGRETACFELKIGKVNAVAVSPDGTRAAAGSLDGNLAVFDLM